MNNQNKLRRSKKASTGVTARLDTFGINVGIYDNVESSVTLNRVEQCIIDYMKSLNSTCLKIHYLPVAV